MVVVVVVRWRHGPDHSGDHGLSTAGPEGHEGLQHRLREGRAGGQPGARPRAVDRRRPQLQQGVRRTTAQESG